MLFFLLIIVVHQQVCSFEKIVAIMTQMNSHSWLLVSRDSEQTSHFRRNNRTQKEERFDVSDNIVWFLKD